MHQFTDAQKERLAALGEDISLYNGTYETPAEANKAFQDAEKKAVKKNRAVLLNFLNNSLEPKIIQLTRSIETALFRAGFARMLTPAIIPKLYLERMSITDEHPLNKQVFYVDAKSCLRPMLAPGLYAVSQKLLNTASLPLRVFETGFCFRKESEGKIHLKEFTMLNIVEWGTPEACRETRLRELARLVLDAAGINDYRFETEESAVYGAGLDITDKNGMELASSSVGPHPLDAAWRISCPWVGIGFGMERLIASKENIDGIHRFARGFSYIDGAALDIK